MDTVVDFISVFIVDPIIDFFRGKFTFRSWAVNAIIGLLLGLVTLACVVGTAYFWYEGSQVLAVLCALAVAVLLIVDACRISHWRKESKKDE